ncbi:tetratricopeptide repeat protein [Hymenobacter sp. J193]|uniref:tetratricopeptide repeat protein n=1 Tax=Hymenobacter sp. J193 TaxID=2898429 RepID=UPI002150A77A|nr:tetratricopeptide repeat protein [Hymenobacter sp. J193]MCR5889495.1 tetratricopeptide repeat protein [Hymenobacter sp. J193]
MRTLLYRLAFVAALNTLSYASFGQATSDDDPVKKLISEGVALHDAGKYDAALARYQEALKLQPQDVITQAEMAITYYALGKYEEALTLSRQAIASPGKKGPNIYATYANSLDALNRPAEAEQAYRDGLKEFPNYYLLLYNLGVTQYGMKKYDDAQQSFQQAVQANPNHPGSNLSWGLGLVDRGKRIPAILALANFLLLEPNTKRSYENLHQLHQLMSEGVEKTAGGGTVIRVDSSKLKASKKGKQKAKADDFGSSELMLSLLSTMDNLPPELAKNPVETFGFQFNMLCQGLVKKEAAPTGFAATHYVPFFNEMGSKGHMTTFAYLIHFSDDEKPYARQWLEQHPDELKDLISFVSEYNWAK